MHLYVGGGQVTLLSDSHMSDGNIKKSHLSNSSTIGPETPNILLKRNK